MAFISCNNKVDDPNKDNEKEYIFEELDKIYADINKILSSTEYKLYIGITSRTIRIISGERLLKEVGAITCR